MVSLDETVFKKGLVLHVVHGNFKVGHITLHEVELCKSIYCMCLIHVLYWSGG